MGKMRSETVVTTILLQSPELFLERNHLYTSKTKLRADNTLPASIIKIKEDLKMKHLIRLILLLSTITTFAKTKSSLVLFACQQYYGPNSELFNRVIILEQTSVKAIKDISKIVDGSALINPKGEFRTRQTAFRMRIYNEVSLISNEKTKKEIIEELLKKPASPDVNGELMDFIGSGSRTSSIFVFHPTPYDFKSLSIDLRDLSSGWTKTTITTSDRDIMYDDSFYQCEKPVLIPIKE